MSITTIFQSTPSARRETDFNEQNKRSQIISIHSLREEGDWRLVAAIWPPKEIFQSTPSARRETHQSRAPHDCARGISIHSLREEGDVLQSWSRLAKTKISIHSLREEGDVLQSWSRLAKTKISIHSLREEGDKLPASQHGS